jgi:peptidoglycan-N-acetylglucosamine deacetylase
MIPSRTPFFLPWLYPSLTWRINTPQKELYLTFDDGPLPGPTEFVLDVLRSASAKATFFCIGDNIKKHPRVFQRIIAEGHAIGNHTFNHINGWKSDVDRYLQNVALCEAAIGGPKETVRLFRPPYGRITRKQIQAMHGFRIIMWDVLTHDYSHALSPELCLRRSINATRNGSIIVFHDSLKAEKNMTYVLPAFIAHFSERGYSFKSLTP